MMSRFVLEQVQFIRVHVKVPGGTVKLTMISTSVDVLPAAWPICCSSEVDGWWP
jgi:hypothetical protein